MRLNPTLILLLAAMTWLLVGCESDTTAPDDSLPPLTDNEVANQAGYLSASIVEVAHLGLTYQGKAAALNGTIYHDFPQDGPVRGRVLLEFLLDGEPSDPDEADRASAWTAQGQPLEIYLLVEEEANPLLLSFTLESDLDQASDPRTALVDGDGTLVAGGYSATWSVEDLLVNNVEPYWPQSGSISFTAGGITATVEFNGTNTATVRVDDLTCTVNLVNAVLTCPEP